MSYGTAYSCMVKWVDGESIQYIMYSKRWYLAARAAKRLAREAQPGRKIKSIGVERVKSR